MNKFAVIHPTLLSLPLSGDLSFAHWARTLLFLIGDLPNFGIHPTTSQRMVAELMNRDVYPMSPRPGWTPGDRARTLYKDVLGLLRRAYQRKGFWVEQLVGYNETDADALSCRWSGRPSYADEADDRLMAEVIQFLLLGSCPVHDRAIPAMVLAFDVTDRSGECEIQFTNGIADCNCSSLILNEVLTVPWVSSRPAFATRLEIDQFRESIANAVAIETLQRWSAFSSPGTGTRRYAVYRQVSEILEKADPAVFRSAIRTMADVITRDPGQPQPGHAWREDEGGNSPQMTRKQDDAAARRVELTGGWRIHYWERRDEAVEFAAVGPHELTDLPENDVSGGLEFRQLAP